MPTIYTTSLMLYSPFFKSWPARFMRMEPIKLAADCRFHTLTDRFSRSFLKSVQYFSYKTFDKSKTDG
jgi:hypothetical protein